MKTFLVIIEAPDRFCADDAKATLEKISWMDGVKILSVMEKQHTLGDATGIAQCKQISQMTQINNQEHIDTPYKVVVEWKCPRCGKNRQATFNRVPTKYNCQSSSKLGICYNCGCPPPELADDTLHFYIPGGLQHGGTETGR